MGKRRSRYVVACLYAVMAGLVPAIHVVRHAMMDVDAWAFAAPKPLRRRRWVEPGRDE